MDVPQGAEDRAAIDDAITVLNEQAELYAAVIGYTDTNGPPALSRRRSLARARHVRELLIPTKIDPSRIVIAARGELLPIATNETEEGRARNRRSVIFFFNPRKGDLKKQYGARIEIHPQELLNCGRMRSRNNTALP